MIWMPLPRKIYSGPGAMKDMCPIITHRAAIKRIRLKLLSREDAAGRLVMLSLLYLWFDGPHATVRA